MRRRAFIGSMIGFGLASAAPTWAQMGSPLAIGAARNVSGEYVYCGIGGDGKILFETIVPVRGHASAVHPKRAEAVALARRPGAYGYGLDLSSGRITANLDISDFGHFYGHGAYDAAGEQLLTTENNLADHQGRIGIWDVQAGYKRLGDVPTGGIGPHEIIRLPKGGYAVANGGILTDPSSERAKLNIPTMAPSLSLFDDDMKMTGQYALPDEYHQLSIRHLAAAGDSIAIGLQWEGDPRELMPVVAIFRDEKIQLIEESAKLAKNYIGSVAANGKGDEFAFTAPKSGTLITCDLSGKITSQSSISEVYGLCGSPQGFIATAQSALIFQEPTKTANFETALEWDNHLKAV